MAITREDVLHVAGLARLELSEAEVERLTRELAHILEHIDQLNAVPTDGVPPTEHIAVDSLPLVEDVPEPGLTPSEALGPAPRSVNDGFAVPAFVDA